MVFRRGTTIIELYIVIISHIRIVSIKVEKKWSYIIKSWQNTLNERKTLFFGIKQLREKACCLDYSRLII